MISPISSPAPPAAGAALPPAPAANAVGAAGRDEVDPRAGLRGHGLHHRTRREHAGIESFFCDPRLEDDEIGRAFSALAMRSSHGLRGFVRCLAASASLRSCSGYGSYRASLKSCFAAVPSSRGRPSMAVRRAATCSWQAHASSPRCISASYSSAWSFARSWFSSTALLALGGPDGVVPSGVGESSSRDCCAHRFQHRWCVWRIPLCHRDRPRSPRSRRFSMRS